MYHKNQNNPDDFDLFTGGKLPELAIGYNLAYDNAVKYIKNLLAKTDNKYDPFDDIEHLPNKAFLYLRHYLWKGNDENKNTSGYELDTNDKEIIKKMLKKLKELRNFHSHIWHTNAMMSFDNDLKNFVLRRHDYACSKLIEENAKYADTSIYYDQLQNFPFFQRNFIKIEGRIFFLSFFLNKGEMQTLLQTITGYKQTNSAAYAFKHKVFTFYCHREGSSWDSTGVENVALKEKQKEEQERILSGRQAYRIFNYLQDIPVSSDSNAIPLIISSGLWVNDMDALLLFISENQILPGFQFYQRNEFFYDDSLINEKESNEQKKIAEKKQREGFRRFRLEQNSSYEFEISYHTLRHITTDIYLDMNEPGFVNSESREHFKQVLNQCIEYRQYIYEELKKAGDSPINIENYLVEKKYSSIYIDYNEKLEGLQKKYYTAEEWRHIPISPTKNTEKLLVDWLGEYITGSAEKPSKKEPEKRKKLLNALRSAQTIFDDSPYNHKQKEYIIQGSFDTSPQPLLFHLSYYYREEEIKNRVNDKFLEWAIRYLVDMQLVPDWFFEQEQLVYEQKLENKKELYKLKDVTVWKKNLQENFRLRIINGKINIGIENDGIMYRLQLGERLVKYLLYWHFRETDKKDKSVNSFLRRVVEDLKMINDVNRTAKIELSELKLLEAYSIPAVYYKTTVNAKNERGSKSLLYKAEVLKFFENKLKWIDKQLDSINKLNRNQKNEAILKAYTLFDFRHTEGQKFLRKNEYEQMSICHFMLNQNKLKVKALLERTFNLRRRLPEEILNIIYSVIETDRENLDDLFLKIFENRKAYLSEKIELINIPGITSKNIKNGLVDYFSIYLDDNNLDAPGLAKREAIRKQMLKHIPFSVHSALALKYFYPEKYTAKHFQTQYKEPEILFKKIRNDSKLNTLLPAKALRETAALAIFQHYCKIISDSKPLQKFIDKWTGSINDIKTKDAFLLLIAEDYLQKYDPQRAANFRAFRLMGKTELQKLFKDEIPVRMHLQQKVKNQLTGEYKRLADAEIIISLRMHQLDDYFFRNQQERLIDLSIFYLNWRSEELNIYKEDSAEIEKINKWPDGSANNPLTVGHLIEARRVNATHAREVVQYIFDYERMIINDYSGSIDKHQKQQLLISFCKQQKHNMFVRFAEVLSWDDKNSKETKEVIQELRNHCLHNHVPLNGSFRKKVMPGTGVADALHIHERLGRNRSEFNIYAIDKTESRTD